MNYDVYNIEAERLFNAKIENLTINKPNRFGLRGRSFYNCILDNIHINHSDNTVGIYGFGTELFVNTLIQNSDFSANSVSVTSAKYPSYGLTWDNCIFSSRNSAGYDSHGDLDVTITNCKVYGILLDFGKFQFDHCDLYTGNTYDFIMSVGEGGLEGLTDISVTNCNIYGGIGNKIFAEGNTGCFMADNRLVFSYNRFYSGKFAHTFFPNVIYKNNVTIDDGITYRLPDTPERIDNNSSYYNDFSSGYIATDFDLNGITAFSALVKAKFQDATTQCLLSSNSYFYWRFRDNNRIELSFKNAAGQTPVIAFNNVMDMDKLWHTYGITLYNDTVRLYIDGLPAQVDTTSFSQMQLFERLVGIGVRGTGTADYVNGSISSVLISDEYWTPEQVARYSENPTLSKDHTEVALLSDKTPSTWLDTSGNVNNGHIGAGITLKNLPYSLSENQLLNIIPTSSAPSNPSEGTIYSNSTDNHIYLNSTWKQLDN